MPIQLPCTHGHTVCNGCISKVRVTAVLAGESQLECPFCKESFDTSTELLRDEKLIRSMRRRRPISSSSSTPSDGSSTTSNTGLYVVIDGCNVAMWGRGARDWSKLALAVEYFVRDGVRPIVVLQDKKMYDELSIDITVSEGGHAVPLRRYVHHVPSQMSYGGIRGEGDDVVTVKLAQHYKCPLVSNDRFRSWKGSLRPSSTLELWLNKAAMLGLQLTFTFAEADERPVFFLPEPEYPFELARRFRDQKPVSAMAPTPPSKERGLVVVCIKDFFARSSEGVRVALGGEKTLADLHTEVATHLRLDNGISVFLYGSDGLPLDRLEATLSSAFCRHGSEQGSEQGAPPETLLALRVYSAGLSRGVRVFDTGLTSNFAAGTYPVLAPPIPMQTEVGMSSACAALYVLKDLGPVDGSLRDQVVAGVCRLASSRAASAAPFAAALKCLCERSLLRQSQKAALIAGLLAATKALFGAIFADAARRLFLAGETQLLEATPQLLAWLCTVPARALTRPALKWRAVSLRALDGKATLECPCKIPGHESDGLFNMEEALELAPLLNMASLQAVELVQDKECFEMMRHVARVPPGTAATLWPVQASVDLMVPFAPSAELLPSLRLLFHSRPDAVSGPFTVFTPTEVKARKHSSLTRHRKQGDSRAVVVVFEPPGSGGNDGSGGKHGEAVSAKGGADGMPTPRGSNLFAPLLGESIAVDLANVARDAAQERSAWQLLAFRPSHLIGPFACSLVHSVHPPSVFVRLRQLSDELELEVSQIKADEAALEELQKEATMTQTTSKAGRKRADEMTRRRMQAVHSLKKKRELLGGMVRELVLAASGGTPAAGVASTADATVRAVDDEEEEALEAEDDVLQRMTSMRQKATTSEPRRRVCDPHGWTLEMDSPGSDQSSRVAATPDEDSPRDAPAGVGYQGDQDDSTVRANVSEATMLVLDVSASMNDRCFRSAETDQGELTGKSRTLFLALRGGPGPAPSDLAAVTDGLCAYFRSSLCVEPPVNVRLHRHRETERWKGSCHLEFASTAAAELALAAVSQRKGPALWGGGCRAELAAEQDQTTRAQRQSASEAETRMAICKLGVQRFSERAVALDLPHACGVLLVGSNVDAHCRLTAALRLFADRAASAMTDDQCERKGGCTRLLMALERAAEELASFRSRQPSDHDVRLRILAVTDGEDTSNDSPLQALQALFEHRITLDVVVLGGATGGAMAALAEFSGGVVLQPVSERDALRAFESEVLLQLAARHAGSPSRQLPTPKQLEIAASRWAHKLRVARQAAPKEAAAAEEAEPRPGGMLLGLPEGDEVSGATAVLASMLAASTAAAVTPKTSGTSSEEQPLPSTARRILQELARVQNEPHPSVQVYAEESTLMQWDVVLSSPASDMGVLYAGGAWRLQIKFPTDYPDRAPTVHFVTPILHLNVNREGRVCHSVLDRDYYPELPMPFLLQMLVQMLVVPDADDPFHEELATWYNRSLINGREPLPDVDTPYRTFVRLAVQKHASIPAETLCAQIDGSAGSEPGGATGPGRSRLGVAALPPVPIPTAAHVQAPGKSPPAKSPPAASAPAKSVRAQLRAQLPPIASQSAGIPSTPEACAPAHAAGSASLRDVLASVHLQQYHGTLVEHGYDVLEYLQTKMSEEELREAAETVGMPKGHVLRFVKLFSKETPQMVVATPTSSQSSPMALSALPPHARQEAFAQACAAAAADAASIIEQRAAAAATGAALPARGTGSGKGRGRGGRAHRGGRGAQVMDC